VNFQQLKNKTGFTGVTKWADKERPTISAKMLTREEYMINGNTVHTSRKCRLEVSNAVLTNARLTKSDVSFFLL
jgi:hypothetical protein